MKPARADCLRPREELTASWEGPALLWDAPWWSFPSLSLGLSPAPDCLTCSGLSRQVDVKFKYHPFIWVEALMDAYAQGDHVQCPCTGSPGRRLHSQPPASCLTASLQQPRAPKPSPGRFHGKGCHLVAKCKTTIYWEDATALGGGTEGLGEGGPWEEAPAGAAFLLEGCATARAPVLALEEGWRCPAAPGGEVGPGCGQGGWELPWKALPRTQRRTAEGKPRLDSAGGVAASSWVGWAVGKVPRSCSGWTGLLIGFLPEINSVCLGLPGGIYPQETQHSGESPGSSPQNGFAQEAAPKRG